MAKTTAEGESGVRITSVDGEASPLGAETKGEAEGLLYSNDDAKHEPTEREALTADLDRIRYRKLAILFSGICWGFFLCFIGLAVGAAIFFSLSAFELFPSFEIPLAPERLVFLCFAAPFIGPLVSSIWAFIRCGQLKRRIAALPE